ncbi:hypothetical protein K437DRAFT_54263 [Tilletiaria anomala UBC 951]|uniref:Uncharacterized protein n=1 Tax=Tilletiaria anomala (strain ATCC 24038 / CBS 436.72 / UBC 951) TaxID=1037660 RepID=A0A066V4V6_TILAU|nr:uncharacterized protein K437DRAFT_54263 [Tilletiaria anomala UBC 951]KDN36486.1 hypothetical protein K437DRAFT_54263 [Tilletiaria anomala UBC 951]
MSSLCSMAEPPVPAPLWCCPNLAWTAFMMRIVISSLVGAAVADVCARRAILLPLHLANLEMQDLAAVHGRVVLPVVSRAVSLLGNDDTCSLPQSCSDVRDHVHIWRTFVRPRHYPY